MKYMIVVVVFLFGCGYGNQLKLTMSNNKEWLSVDLARLFLNPAEGDHFRVDDAQVAQDFGCSFAEPITDLISMHLGMPPDHGQLTETLTVGSQPVKFLLFQRTIVLVVIDDGSYPNKLKRTVTIPLYSAGKCLTMAFDALNAHLHVLCEEPVLTGSVKQVVYELPVVINVTTGVIESLHTPTAKNPL